MAACRREGSGNALRPFFANPCDPDVTNTTIAGSENYATTDGFFVLGGSVRTECRRPAAFRYGDAAGTAVTERPA